MIRMSDKELVLLWQRGPSISRVAALAGVEPGVVWNRVRELLRACVRLKRVGALKFASPPPPPLSRRPSWVHRLNAVIDALRREGVML